ncbi:MAG: Gfo/Idh/MocA family oxidoreductase, partial [Bacteroidota bacterium]
MSTTRRQFLQTASVATGLTFVPSWLSAGITGPSPNARLNLGVIGTGRQAIGLAKRTLGMPEHRIVAACDVYAAKLEEFTNTVSNKYVEMAGGGTAAGAGIKNYSDYRELLEHDGLDAVLIATPDHQHAPMCIAALERGLHVYCEKPLAHTIEEGRAIVDAVTKSGKLLQTGSMQRSMRPFRKAVDLIQAGKIGKLREAVVSIGPPPRKFDLPEQSLPQGLDWQAWVGPSVTRPFHDDLAPGLGQKKWAQWRAFAEYGGGMVTDWGAHMFDIVQW